MPKAIECFCWNDLSEVNTKGIEKNVVYSGFRCNCLEINVLEEYYYEYQEANGPPLEDELIHEYVQLYLKNIDSLNMLSFFYMGYILKFT